ncbi:hypothetical protein FK529_11045 [Tsukamurella asaccharolytica]|uniref:DUF308 domain-containing protein n=1 Tax=Tsukamurella asaccharolytica TaxID=2592067 RepID=A0A5C5RAH6_9ACTN|nr:hypothetical protein [Tsukamurella asaccharolytica]TWS19692.1 hypothetical protein FK529_11045 [Tsukamurella asaccharolytica]
MLLAALGATVIGFILLIVALVTANLWLAIACVVVSVIGVGLLLGDVLTYRRGERDGADRTTAWSPGDRDDDADGEEPAPSARPARAAAPEGEAEEPGSAPEPVDDATREAGTVGHEEFGHHGDANSTRQFSAGPLAGATAWAHESPADTDDEATRGLYAPGTYDPDMTDQIPQVRIDQAWGTEWTPPRESESEDPGRK